MIRALALLAALLLGGCTSFTASAPLFSPGGGAHPFPDGAIIEMRHDGAASDQDEQERFALHVAGGGYNLSPAATEKAVLPGLVFTPVPDTPFEDYVLQMPDAEASPVVNFGFVWRTSVGLRLVTDPAQFEDMPAVWAWMQAHCGAAKDRDCEFHSAADVLAFHRDFIAPLFIRKNKAPRHYDDLILVGRFKPRRAPPALDRRRES